MTITSVPAPPGHTLLHPIAAGGMAKVFAATQHSLGREVAVKIMSEGDATMAERFLHEAQLVAALNHPHIVHIYDVGRLDDGRPYLSMELLSGGDLSQRLREGLGDTDVYRILRQLAEGLAVVHERGIIHRDIKPANILFRDNGDAVLSDFGIAKSNRMDVNLTQVGTVVGSPAYSSPEQVSAKPLDARSDLYSLGVVLLEMLTGSNPFRGSDYGSTVANQLQMTPPRLPAAQARWQRIVDRLLAKQPERRYASAAALLDDLDAQAVTRKRVPPPGDTDATLVNARVPAAVLATGWWRHLRLRVVLAALVVVALGLLGWRHFHHRDPQISAWLDKADERFSQGQLGDPPGDNATFYYKLVLKRDAHNGDAQKGLIRIVERYAELAAEARKQGQLDQAQAYVEQGLELRPEDPVLLGLREEIRAARHAQRQNSVQRFFNKLLGN